MAIAQPLIRFTYWLWQMWELDHKESWAPKNWCFWTVVLEKTLESPLDCKEIKPVNPKGNQSWIFIGKFDADTEAPILWPPDVKSLLNEKRWYWEKLKVGEEEDETGQDGWMASPTQWKWFEKSPGDGEGWGNLACCSPWCCKELDMTERLNNNDYSMYLLYSTLRFRISVGYASLQCP